MADGSFRGPRPGDGAGSGHYGPWTTVDPGFTLRKYRDAASSRRRPRGLGVGVSDQAVFGQPHPSTRDDAAWPDGDILVETSGPSASQGVTRSGAASGAAGPVVAGTAGASRVLGENSARSPELSLTAVQQRAFSRKVHTAPPPGHATLSGALASALDDDGLRDAAAELLALPDPRRRPPGSWSPEDRRAAQLIELIQRVIYGLPEVAPGHIEASARANRVTGALARLRSLSPRPRDALES